MDIKTKFRNKFVTPLVISILFCILATIIILTIYTKNQSSSEIYNNLKSIEQDLAEKKVKSSSLILRAKIQKVMNLLNLANDYFYFYINKQEYLDSLSQDISSKTISNLVNGYQIFLDKDIAPPYTSRALWFIDHEQISISTVNIDSQHLVYHVLNNFSKIIPLVKAVHQSNPYVEAYSYSNSKILSNHGTEIAPDDLPNPNGSNFPNFYLVYSKENIFAIAPLYVTFSFYNALDSYQNEEDCVDSKGNYISYYKFQCRDWYKLSYKNALNEVEYHNAKIRGTETSITDVRQFTISYPYKSADDITKYTITICRNTFYNPNVDNATQEISIDDLLIFCTDLDLGMYTDLFDFYNSNIEGYFFSLLVDINIPIYYPKIGDSTYLTTIEQLEFNKNEKYLAKELINFKNVVKDFTHNLNQDYYEKNNDNTSNSAESQTYDFIDTSLFSSVTKGSYYKNEVLYTYKVFPIFLKTSEESYYHYFSFIYIYDSDTPKQTTKAFESLIIQRIVIQIFLFIVIGIILFLITWFLVSIIADWIIKPIMSMKHLIEGIGNEASTNFEPNNEIDTINNNSEEDEEKGDDISSGELGKLLNLLIEIKNCLHFTSSKKLAIEDTTLIDYIKSEDTFKQVSNIKGKNLSNSNVGNIFYLFDKYDKSVIHYMNIVDVKQLEEYITEMLQNNYDSMFGEHEDLFITITNFLKRRILKLMNSKMQELSKVVVRSSQVQSSNIIFNKGKSKLFSNNQSLVNKDKISKLENKIISFKQSLENNVEYSEIITNNLNNTMKKQRTSLALGVTTKEQLSKKLTNTENIELSNTQSQVQARKSLNSLINSPQLGAKNQYSDVKGPDRQIQNESYKEDTFSLILERYRKIIQAFKCLYKQYDKIQNYYNDINFKISTSKLNRCKLISEEIEYLRSILDQDIYNFKEIHSLDNFHSILLSYLLECVNYGNYEYICESILEYIEFLLNFRLKISNNFDLESSYKKQHDNDAASNNTNINNDLTIANSRNNNNNNTNNSQFTHLNNNYSNTDYLRLKELLKGKEYLMFFFNNKIELSSSNNNNFNDNKSHYTNHTTKHNNINNINNNNNTNINYNKPGKIVKDYNLYKGLISFVSDLFENFDSVYNKLKEKVNQEFYKNILEEINKSKKDSSIVISQPFVILKQKSFYLKGLFAMYCGHYLKALEFFSLSRKTKIICDAGIITKSITQIKRITEYLEIKLTLHHSNLSDIYSTIQSKTKHSKVIVKEQISNESKMYKQLMEKVNKNIEASKSFIISLNQELDSFCLKSKDVIVLIDISENMKNEVKKIERSIKIAKNIYFEVLSQNDRYALFTFSDNINSRVKLSYKTNNNFSLIQIEHESLMSNIMVEDSVSARKRKKNKLNKRFTKEKLGKALSHINHSSYGNTSNMYNNNYNNNYYNSDDNYNDETHSLVDNNNYQRHLKKESRVSSNSINNYNKNSTINSNSNNYNNNNKRLIKFQVGDSKKAKDKDNYNFKVSVYNVYSYLKKVSNTTREKWVIIFTDSYLKKKTDSSIFNLFKPENNSGDVFNVILVGYNLSNDIYDAFKEKLKDINNSIVLDSEHTGLIYDLLKGCGTISKKKIFGNEVYEADDN